MPTHNPSPEEIREAAAEIRKGWSEEEHRRRAGAIVEPYAVPQVTDPEMHK